MAENCIFCRIVAGELPASMVYEDETVVAFKDIRPQAPVHVLVVPREHVDSIAHLDDSHAEMAGKTILAVEKVARAVGGLEEGYRVIINCGEAGGQTVPHLHLHLLGGRRFSEGMVRD
ncbi:MAG TPA: histidine triad nucleotide-binding protein [Longimicrobiaceae bacterium]